MTGATGRLGRVLTPELARAGHAVRATSRTAPADGPGIDPARMDPARRNPAGVGWVRLDLATSEGLGPAVEDIDTVVHLASAPYQRGYTRKVDVDGTRRLVEAAGRAGVRHLVYLSIVGADRMPWPYFKAKIEAEAIVAAGPVPWTVLRVTQFHDLLDEAMAKLTRLPVLPVDPEIVGQPVDVRDVAAHLVSRVTAAPAGAIEEFAGPTVLGFAEGLRDWLTVRQVRRPLLRLPVPGRLGRAFRAGALTSATGNRRRISWHDYLVDRAGRLD
ncbi:NAD(P)H-binding protein [Plantactinospora sp. S1510]|uniref:NAD(P)H-binding protein n=1 Tax=Plantactinospora alkalitolerans TaxID=2789879 RepID=A0ABS0H1L6_9ACTN|nr:NAD(P)H-binding protein [Plantactinospora alkalitolerans]